MTHSDLLQNLLTLPTVLNAALSPDRRWVAFEWYRVHANVDVFLAPCDGSAAPLALCHTAERTELIGWAPDSSALLVAEDHDSDERSRLFRIDLNLDAGGQPHPGAMQPLTEDRPPYFLRGGWLSPDGQALYYGANYDFEHNRPSDASILYRHDLTSGERTALARPQKPAYLYNELNRAGTHLLYLTKDRHPSGFQVNVVDSEGGQSREVLAFGDRRKVLAHWLPDSLHLAFISEATERTAETGQPYRSVGIAHALSGQVRWLVDDPARNVEDIRVSPDGALILDEIRDAGHAPTYIDPPVGGWSATDAQALTEHAFPRLPGNLRPLGRAADGAWIALHYSSTSPVDLVRLNPQDGQPASLTGLWQRTALRPQALTAAEDWRWTSVDGRQIQGWLYRAVPNPGRAIVYIHGGPTAHSEDRLNVQLQYFVSQGFNVLDVNYRGSSGFGMPFREAIKEDGWGGREQDDIACGAQALIDAGLAQPGRVGVTGTSYGGYSAWCQITHYPPEVIGAAAPICGMT
ncbi:MAG: prolyl oligopeptidase family serine peptidase, partial [Chloroflexota bacterium]